MRSLCLKVPREEAESIRKKLLQHGVLDQSLRIKHHGASVIFPITSADLPEMEMKAGEEDFEEREVNETDYTKLAEVPSDLKGLLPTSFDVIGNVAIVKLPEELLPFSPTIGRAFLQAFPRLRSVALDRGVKGEWRVRDLEVIAGERSTETSHTEYGVRFLIDPAKVYFNPRLANERKRIASLVREGERVIDMFAGVGPFAIMIAKYAEPEIVFALDLNPDAFSYLQKNIALNKVTKVVPMLGDSKDLIYDLPCADRIVMNLPHSARGFFHDALARLNLGGTIHFFTISDRGSIQSLVDEMLMEAAGTGVKIEASRMEELKTYSPSMSVYSLDLLLVDWA